MMYQEKTMREKRKALQLWMVSTTSRVVLCGCVILFGVLYILETSAISTKGYEMSDLQKQIQELEQENERIDVAIADHRSMESIERRVKDLNLVLAGDVTYVSPVGTAVARR
ncbi:MAG TPA: septum formation initiator family protein [Candidatus Kapabacteria bacterium]|nr:septum formation initiator family protein [Candidatus Kapabacteria bacterium]